MAKLDKVSVVGVKTETVQGTSVSLSATDYLVASDATIKINAEKLVRDFSRPTFDTLPTIQGLTLFECSFKTELKNGGTAGTVYAPLDAAIRACGFTGSTAVSTSVTYTPETSASNSSFFGAGRSATIEVYKDGLKHVVAGAVGNMKLSLEAGKLPMAEFNFKGTYTTVTDAAMPAVTYASTLPVKVQSVNFTASGSNSHIPSKLEIDCGNATSEIHDVNSAHGFYGLQITGRSPVGSFDPLAVNVSVHDFLGKMVAGSQMAASFIHGTVAGNIISGSMPNVQYNDASFSSRNDLLAFQIPLRFNGSSETKNDWLTLTFA